jgi:hypothetical protein
MHSMHCGSSSDDNLKQVRSAAKRGSRTWRRRGDGMQMGSSMTRGVDWPPTSLYRNNRHKCTGNKARCDRSCRHESHDKGGHDVNAGV